MSLSEQLKKDIVAAMKGKEEMRLSVLRMAKAALPKSSTLQIPNPVVTRVRM